MSAISEKPIHKHRTHVKIVRHIVTEPIVEPVTIKADRFRRVSQKITNKLGSPTAFLLAIALIVVWIASGPVFDYSDTWQLVINTATTIITFLMVFAIQNSQNREARTTQLKLNELIKSSHGARIEFIDLEDLTDGELDTIQDQFKEIHDKLQSKTKATTK